jgi:hypothetical protein
MLSQAREKDERLRSAVPAEVEVEVLEQAGFEVGLVMHLMPESLESVLVVVWMRFEG